MWSSFFCFGTRSAIFWHLKRALLAKVPVFKRQKIALRVPKQKTSVLMGVVDDTMGNIFLYYFFQMVQAAEDGNITKLIGPDEEFAIIIKQLAKLGIKLAKLVRKWFKKGSKAIKKIATKSFKKCMENTKKCKILKREILRALKGRKLRKKWEIEKRKTNLKLQIDRESSENCIPDIRKIPDNPDGSRSCDVEDACAHYKNPKYFDKTASYWIELEERGCAMPGCEICNDCTDCIDFKLCLVRHGPTKPGDPDGRWYKEDGFFHNPTGRSYQCF